MASLPKIRLFVDQPLAAGARVMLSDAQAHYVRHVMRAAAGEALALFNGRAGEWHGAVGFVGKGGVLVAVETQVRPQTPTPGPVLLFAPVKREANEWLIEKATELGVARLQPVLTARTESQRPNLPRWQTIATEAAEQCERLDVPPVSPPLALPDLLAQWPRDRTILVCAEAGEVRPIAAALAACRSSAAALLIGPAGGFAPAELDLLRQTPFAVPVGLGPRILRAETAAIAALACWQGLIGDWQAEDARPLFRQTPE
jgi:16S rRNA (uracil1498-N3)-methyltransferase